MSSTSESYHVVNMERLVVCSFTWAVETGMYGIIGFMVSSVPVLV